MDTLKTIRAFIYLAKSVPFKGRKGRKRQKER